MRRRPYIIALLAITVLAVLAGVVAYVVRERAADRERNEAKPALFSSEASEAYTDLDGNKIDIAGVEGKIVIATSWASWCPQCVEELQLLNDLALERNDDRVQVLALNRMEPKHQAQRFMATLPSLPSITFVLDNQDHFFNTVLGYAMPETIFYNAEGEIVLHKRGNLTKEEAVAALEKALTAD